MTTPVQTTGYKLPPSKARPGQLADGAHDIASVSCDAADGTPPGLLVIRTRNGDMAGGPPVDITADPDSIYTSHPASGAGAQNLTEADWDGVLADGGIFPPRKLTITLNSHADWDATTGSWTFPDENGVLITEAIDIPNAGNVTRTSTAYASGPPTAVSIPQQTSANATYQIGTSASATLEGGDVLGVSVREHHGRTVPVFDDNEIWDDQVEFGALRQGRIYVQMENAFVAGSHPYVRLVAGVGEQRGRFRTGPDGSDGVVVRRIRLMNSGDAGEYAVIDVRL